MIEETYQIHLFYPLLFLVIIVAIVTIGVVVGIIKRGISGDNKDTFIFAKAADNAKEITLDNNKTHKEIVAGLPIEYHRELHQLEKDVKDNNNRIIQLAKELNDKMDLLVDRVTHLEKMHK